MSSLDNPSNEEVCGVSNDAPGNAEAQLKEDSHTQGAPLQCGETRQARTERTYRHI